jgi:hypothetical protein
LAASPPRADARLDLAIGRVLAIEIHRHVDGGACGGLGLRELELLHELGRLLLRLLRLQMRSLDLQLQVVDRAVVRGDGGRRHSARARRRHRDGGARLRFGELALQTVELAAQRLLACIVLAHLVLGGLPAHRVLLAALLLVGLGLLIGHAPLRDIDQRLVRAGDELVERVLDLGQRRRRSHQRRRSLGAEARAFRSRCTCGSSSRRRSRPVRAHTELRFPELRIDSHHVSPADALGPGASSERTLGDLGTFVREI